MITRAFALLLAVSAAAQACSLCGASFGTTPTFRQEAAMKNARAILHGTASNPRLKGDGLMGETDFEVKTILRTHDVVKGKKSLVLPRYLPVPDRDKPPQYLLFCDDEKGRVDPYRGVPVRGPRTVDYFQKALKLDPKDAAANLTFFFGYLEDTDPEVGRDAFLEFAKATDADVAAIAPKLSPDKLRTWLKDENTQPARLGIYAMLLGACGKADDAAFLLQLLGRKEDRYQGAADGLLAGYLRLEPAKGWALIHDTLADGRRPLTLRLKALGTMRFENNAHPKEARPEIAKVMKTVLAQGELADLAIEDMRAWKIWDHTAAVVALYGKKGFDAPLMQRAILRYVLSCPETAQTKAFLAERRKADAELVREVEEGLRLERAG
ncbi:MAG: hypothetical protein ACRC33_07065 [Gemmataceae bacterium]